MSSLFLHPPLTDAEVARIVFGRPPAGPPAQLAGHALATDADGVRVGLRVQPGASVAGRLADPEPEARARLGFLMAAFGAAPAAVEVATPDGARPAQAFLLAEGADLRPVAPGPPEEAAFSAEAVREVMDHCGRRAAEAMPALLPGIAPRALARSRGRSSAPAPHPLGCGYTSADVDVDAASPERVYAGFFGVEVHRLRHRRFDGTMSQQVERAVFASADAVTVLPFDPHRGAVLLIEQFRPGALARCDPSPWFLEAIAGRIDVGETAEAAARREAREEAGLTLGRLERVAAFYTSPGICAEYVTAFVAEADLGQAGGTHGLEAEHEDIRTQVVPLDAALALGTDGAVRNAPLLVPLLWLAGQHARLARDWAGTGPRPVPSA